MARKAAKKTKTKAKKTTKKAKKTVAKRAKAPARKAKKAVKKATPRKAAAKKTTARRTKNVKGEGSYTASRNFRGKEEAFIKKNKAKIPAMAKAAEAALKGPEGRELEAAEAATRERGEGMDQAAE